MEIYAQPSLQHAALAPSTRPLNQVPNEILDMILKTLPRASLKQARLVCRRWGTSAAAFLLSTVYLSPREMDMNVFDNITSHPSISKSVKEIFYETAFFPNYSPQNYFFRLCSQLNHNNYRRWRMEDPYVQSFIATINGPPVWPLSKAAQPHRAFDRVQDHSAFRVGFDQYSQLAQQQTSILLNSWLFRAWQGLQRLGDIHTVTFGTRWRTRLLKVPVTESELKVEQRADDEVDLPSTTGDWPGVGSPVARAWPATFLLPTVTTFQSSYTYASSFPHEYIKDGSLAFNLVLRLLQFSNKKPQRLAMLREDPECYAAGLPPWIFDPAWPNQKQAISCIFNLL